MRHLLTLLALCVPLFAQTTVSNVRVDAIGYSTARVTWDTSGGTVSNYLQRIRYGTTNAYDGGAGGGIQFQRNLAVATDYQMTLSGLAPNTLYYICPQVSDDNGSTWSACVETTFTTLARPSPSPSLPVAPEAFSTAYPDTSGYTARAVASDCSDLQAKINEAVANQATAGSVITIPAGTACSAGYSTPNDPSAKFFAAVTDVNISTDRITIAGHGYTEGQAIRITRYAGCLPGSSPGVPDAFCQLRGPLIQGQIYYVRNPATDDFQLSATVDGTVIDLTDVGSGTNAVAAWPPAHSNWIVIRTATPDAEFCPEGTRCLGSVWGSKMPKLEITGGTFSNGLVALKPGLFAHHIRLMGLEITHTATASADSPDPRPTYGLLDFSAENGLSYITIDRSYIHGRGYPDRIYRPVISWDGKYLAIIDSDMSKWDYWRPGKTGWGVSLASPTVTIAAGTYQLSASTACVAAAPLTFTRAGGSSSTASYVYLATDCTPTMVVPTGVTASCTGTVDDGGVPRACSVIESGTPAFPRDGFNGFACGTLAQVDSSGAAWTSAYDPYGNAPSAYATEGTQGMVGGWGPGPYKLENNYSEGAGLLWHFDDSAGKISVGEGYTIRRNTFVTTTDKRTNGAGSTGLRYMQRNGIEWKNGTRSLIEGNTWDGLFADVSSTGCAIVFTGIGGGNVSDATVRYNTVRDSSCFLLAIGGLPWPNGITEPFQRLHVHDNLLINLNGYQQYEPQARLFGNAFPFYIGYAMEDVIIDHNLVYDNRGPNPHTFHWIQNPLSGVSITNNIFWINNDNNSQGMFLEIDSRNNPTCSGAPKAMMDCLLRDGVGNPSYTYSSNLLVPFYSNSQSPSGLVDLSATATAYSGLSPYVITGADASTRLANVGFYAPESRQFRLKANSAFQSGGGSPGRDGRALGADVDALEAAQGRVRNVRVLSIGSTTASVYFTAPDSVGCTVDYSTASDLATFTRAINAGGQRVQSVSLSGLSADTTYYFRVNCAVEQPTGSFRTAAGS